ncbi:MAG: hypothetical protein AB1657_01910 [Candidatus Micrarchaeota archaeon]
MAKPIRSTPTLHGEDAVRFVKEMLREQRHPSRARVETIKKAVSEFKYFSRYLRARHPGTSG